MAICVFGNGCATRLPDGNPPTGPIVANVPAASCLSVAAAQRLLATSLSPALLREFAPGSTIICRQDFVTSDPTLVSLPDGVLKQVDDLFRFREDRQAALILTSRIAPAEILGQYCWSMELRRDRQILWREQVRFRISVPR